MTYSFQKFFLVLLLLVPTLGLAKGVYQSNDAFLLEAFASEPPAAKMLWLSGDLKTDVAEIMGHPYGRLRVKYWQKAAVTVWILEEIGKEKPITTGFIVDNGAIQQVKVLAFRETRGWEVKHPFFTRQFDGVSLKQNQRLNKNIDGITGATLSVRAITKLSRLALYFHQHVKNKEEAA